MAAVANFYSQYPQNTRDGARPSAIGYRPVHPAAVRIACGLGAPFGYVAAGLCFYFLIQPFGANPPPKEVALIAGIVFTCTAIALSGIAIFYRGRQPESALAERRLESLSGLQKRIPDRTATPVAAEVRPAPTAGQKRRSLASELMGVGALLGILIGPGIAYLAYQRQKVLDMGKPEPRVFRVAELGKNGPGDNIHVKVTDFEFGDQYFLRSQRGSWKDVCLAAFPKGKVGDPQALRVVVRTSRVHDEKELREFGTRTELQGVVVNSIYESENDKNFMRDAYPGVDTSRIWVVQENYTFPNQSEIQTMYTISSGIIGLAVFCGIGAMVRRLG
jgi:hypothetical protein